MSRFSNFVNNYCSNKESAFNSLKLAEFSTNDSTISIIHDKFTLKNEKNIQNIFLLKNRIKSLKNTLETLDLEIWRNNSRIKELIIEKNKREIINKKNTIKYENEYNCLNKKFDQKNEFFIEIDSKLKELLSKNENTNEKMEKIKKLLIEKKNKRNIINKKIEENNIKKFKLFALKNENENIELKLTHNKKTKQNLINSLTLKINKLTPITTKLNNEIINIEKKLNETQTESSIKLDKMNSDNNLLTQQNKNITQNLNFFLSSLSNLKKMKIDLEENLISLKQKNKTEKNSLENRILELKTLIKSKTEEILEKKQNIFQITHDSANRISQNKNSINDLNTHIEKLEKDQKNLEKNIQEFIRKGIVKNEKLKQKTKLLKGLCFSLGKGKEIEKLKDKKKQLLNKKKEIENNIKELKNKKNNFSNLINCKNEENSNTNQNFDEIKLKINQIKLEKTEIQENLIKIQQEIELKEKEKIEKSDLKTNYLSKLQKMKEEISLFSKTPEIKPEKKKKKNLFF